MKPPLVIIVVVIINKATGLHNMRHLFKEKSIVSLHSGESLFLKLQTSKCDSITENLEFFQLELKMHVRLGWVGVDLSPHLANLHALSTRSTLRNLLLSDANQTQHHPISWPKYGLQPVCTADMLCDFQLP